VSIPLRPALADLLAYLGEMGYGDLYLNPKRATSPVEARPPVSAPIVAAAPPPVPMDEETAARIPS